MANADPVTLKHEAAKNFLRVIYDPGVENTEVDIVAVHGLNPDNSDAHAENTWTKDNKLWLKDFLPEKLSTARVLLFGYNANVTFETSTAGVLEQALNLLHWIRMRRHKINAENRPIVFIAHSLGGIVVKRALVVASQVEKYKPTRKATYGMVFFATPHRGGEFGDLGKIATKIVKAVFVSYKSDFIEALEKDNLFGSTMIDDFRSMLEDFKVASFYETRPIPNVGIVVDKKSAILGLNSDRETQLALDLDHRSICKFDRTSDEYELVEDTVVEMVEEAIEYSDYVKGAGTVSPRMASSDQVPTSTNDDTPALSVASPQMTAGAASPRPEWTTLPGQSTPRTPDPTAIANERDIAPPMMISRASTYSESFQSLAISDDRSDPDRRQSSSSAQTSVPSADATGATERQSQSPGLFRSIAMNLTDGEGSTFRKAAAQGKKDTVKLMLSKGQAVDNSGVGHGFTALAEAALNGHEDVVRLLLDAGADPAFNCISTLKQFGSIENTPLALASGKGHLGCMSLLLQAHQYSTDELDRAYRAARYRNRADAIRLIKGAGGGNY